MRDDLLHAQACLDWVEAQLPSFQGKLDSWARDAVDFKIEETPSSDPYNQLVVTLKSSLPAIFNVEFGAYINSIRSSLDLLAVALAGRHGYPHIEKVQFPIADSEETYLNGKYKGDDFVKKLPPKERGILDQIRPYQGGNDRLWYLHKFDIQRKHRNLLDIEMRPLRVAMKSRHDDPGDFFKAVRYVSVRPGVKTVIGLLDKDFPKPRLHLKPIVAVKEEGLPMRKPVIATVIYFHNAVAEIIRSFDY